MAPQIKVRKFSSVMPFLMDRGHFIPKTWVPLWGICGGFANAVAGVLQDGREAEVRGPVAGRGQDGGAVPGVRDLAQDRLQDLPALQGLRHRGADGSIP